MPRPKANTEAGRIATEKWRKTMIEKYGSEEAFKHAIRCMGSLGGRVKTSKPKGFAANPKLARKAGRKGGKKSRRTGVTTGEGQKKEYYYNGDRQISNSKPTPRPAPTPKPEPEKKSFIQRVFGGR